MYFSFKKFVLDLRDGKEFEKSDVEEVDGCTVDDPTVISSSIVPPDKTISSTNLDKILKAKNICKLVESLFLIREQDLFEPDQNFKIQFRQIIVSAEHFLQ